MKKWIFGGKKGSKMGVLKNLVKRGGSTKRNLEKEILYNALYMNDLRKCNKNKDFFNFFN